jgi:murein DD-endopeptidase MepM/ murein hydrolase activator NlpD
MRFRGLILVCFFLGASLSASSVITLHYVFPVRPTLNMTYTPIHHDYPATDIFCPVGYDYLAVTDGVIDYVCEKDEWTPSDNIASTRGGLSIAFIGDDGVRYYGSHLSKISPDVKVGVRVVAGQVLGQIGDTGNAKPEGPQLHFGMSQPTSPADWKTRRGEILPYPFLVLWEKESVIAPRVVKKPLK